LQAPIPGLCRVAQRQLKYIGGRIVSQERSPIVQHTEEQLAIYGGPKSLDRAAPIWPPADDDVRRALEAAWADGSWGRYRGPHVERLSAELSAMHGLKHVLPVCSGTFAVELALRGLKVSSGDEVLLAGYDFPGNFRAIEAVQARPVLVDIEPDSCLVHLDRIEAAIAPATRAIVVSHLHGMLLDMPRLMEMARRRHLVVVEDACQAAGAAVAGRPAGSWGDVGVLSFGGSKLLSAGRGGAVLTADPEIHQRMKVYCHRGNDAFPLSELQAAVLVPQLSKLAERTARREAGVRQLLTETEPIAAMRPLVNRLSAATPAYYKVAWHYAPSAAGNAPINEFANALVAEGAPFDRGFRGFAGRGERRCRKTGSLEHSRRAADSTLLLHHPILLEPTEQISAIARAMRKVAAAFAAR
jgi:dTDP-4-amino-4,6-dideoxygalactose transaminase